MHISDTTGGFAVQASSTINAPLDCVWSVLVDLERYHEWNTFVPVMQSSFQVGELLTMQVRMNKRLTVKSIETITAIEPMGLLAWKTRSPGWLLRGERFQTLTPIDANTTRYWTREAFMGLLAPVLKITLGKDLQRGFHAVAEDLKARAEALDLLT
ncbi:MAG TPA: SRPBCC domain-containing protein [Ktedonobacteraceae bacterium]|nr:SRPBCC domain-containing protein [Ktedonobacteraceae bacterium]